MQNCISTEMCRQKYEQVVKNVEVLTNNFQMMQRDLYANVNDLKEKQGNFMKRSTFFKIIGGGFSVIIPAIFIALNYMNQKVEDKINDYRINSTQFQSEIKQEIKDVKSELGQEIRQIRKEIQSIALNVGKIQVKFENSIIE